MANYTKQVLHICGGLARFPELQTVFTRHWNMQAQSTPCFHKMYMQDKKAKKNVQFKNGEIHFPLKFLCFRGFVSHKVSLNKHVFLRLMFLLYFDSLSNINPVLKRSALKVIRYSHFVLPLVKILS